MRETIQRAPVNRKARLAKRIVQVGGHVLWEKLTRPKARRPEDVPSSGEAITRQWLTAVLCRDHPGAEVASFRIPGGSSGTSTRRALKITYNDAGRAQGLPTELYTKTTTSLTQRLVIGLANVIEGEPRFYAEIRPQVDVEAPKGYFTAVDPRSWRSLALIEDVVATKGATFCTPKTPISRERIEDLLANMATLHGAFWNSPVLHTRSWIKTAADHVSNISEFVSMRQRSRVGARRARAVIPEALRDRQDDLWKGLERSMELGSNGVETLMHGDPHIANTYVTAGGRMGYGDWQMILRGCWGFDVTYLVTTALTVEDRRRWERELLAFYLERLAQAGGEAPGFEEAWLTYRQQSFYPYFAWVFTIGRSALMPKFQPVETCVSIIERTSNAILDLESLEAVGV